MYIVLMIIILIKTIYLFESYSETDFTAVISSSTWPSNQYWVCFNNIEYYFMIQISNLNMFSLQYDMAIGLNPNLDKQNLIKERVKIQQDYARVDIYYQTLNLKRIEQSPAISVCIKIFTKIKLPMQLHIGIILG